MATIADKFIDLAEPVHRQLFGRHRGNDPRPHEIECEECSQPVERSRQATSYGFPRLCRQCEIDS